MVSAPDGLEELLQFSFDTHDGSNIMHGRSTIDLDKKVAGPAFNSGA